MNLPKKFSLVLSLPANSFNLLKRTSFNFLKWLILNWRNWRMIFRRVSVDLLSFWSRLLFAFTCTQHEWSDTYMSWNRICFDDKGTPALFINCFQASKIIRNIRQNEVIRWTPLSTPVACIITINVAPSNPFTFHLVKFPIFTLTLKQFFYRPIWNSFLCRLSYF